jgi:hypothetical protein
MKYLLSHSMTTQRITITVQSDLHKKLRFIQADMLKKSNGAVSMSGVIDTVLRRGLK